MKQSGNPLLLESSGVIWQNVQRVMSEVLFRGDAPAWAWDDHTAIPDAVVDGDGDRAEQIAREHAQQLILDALTSVRVGRV